MTTAKSSGVARVVGVGASALSPFTAGAARRLQTPILSIVTVVRDDEDGLQATLDSVLSQRRGLNKTEIIVVDAASTDGSVDRARARLRRRDTLISEPDSGVYDGMNKGWRASRGRFVQFLNSGDTLHDVHSLGAIIDALAANPDARWLIGRARHLKGGVGRAGIIDNIPHVWWRHAMGHQSHCHQATFFSRTILDVMDGYALDVGFVSDFDLIMRCGVVASPVELDRVIVDYEGGGLSAVLREQIPQMLHDVRVRRLGLSDDALQAEEALLPAHHREILDAASGDDNRGRHGTMSAGSDVDH